VFIALRDTEKEEDAIIERLGIKVIRVAEVREKGAAHAVKDTLAHLKGCDRLHVSFDVDSLDTSISKGTGTPVDDGLMLDEAQVILNGLMADQRSMTMDVVEINPALDDRNRMAEAVLPLLDSVYEVVRAR
jgi:arginase